MATRPVWQSGQSGVDGYLFTWGATFLFFMGFYTILVPLPRYLAAIGLSDWQVGVVFGAFGVASLLIRPIAGVVVDRWGAQRVMQLGAGVLLLSSLAVPATTHVLLLAGLRLCQAAGYVAFTTASTALVIAITPVAQRGQRLAVFGIAANVALMIAPSVTEWLLSWQPLAAGFGLAAGMALLAGLATWPLSAHKHTTAVPNMASHMPQALWLPMLMAGLFGAGFGAFFQYAPVLADRRGVVEADTLYQAYGVGIILMRLISRTIQDHWPLRRILVVAASMKVAGLLLLGLSLHPWLLITAAMIIAGGSGVFHPALLAYHAAIWPEAPGRATAASYIGFDLGIGGGSFVVGVALQYAVIPGLYLLAAAITALVLPLTLCLPRG